MQTKPKSPRRMRVECGTYQNPSTGGFEIRYTKTRAGEGRDAGPGAARPTFGEVGEEWLELQSHLRPRTHDLYRTALRRHLAPRIGAMPIGEVDEEVIARVISALAAQGLSGWTVRGIPRDGDFHRPPPKRATRASVG